MSILSVHGLCKAFGGVRALANVSFDVGEGEFLALIGPNGAGKSTFFNCLTGDLAVTSGSVHFNGFDVTRAAPERRARLGLARTFQVPLTFESMSVLDNVTIGALLRHHNAHDARSRARDVLQRVGLGPLSDAPAKSLGTPGRKRLEIARALGTRPRLLLLDEPAAGMNPAETHEITELIGRLRDERGVAILVIEHDMHVVGGVSDRVVALDHGVKIAEGGFDAVANHPAVVEAYMGRDPAALQEPP